MQKDLIFAIDLGGTSTKMAILQLDGTVKHQWQIPTDTRENGKHIVENIGRSFTEKLLELKMDKSQFVGAGIGAPGPAHEGKILNAVNLGWGVYPLQDKLNEVLGLPAFISNDANCAALGEMWMGSGRGYGNLVFITLGTGVGGGIIINGQIVEGVRGGAGEIGHMPVTHSDGFRCNCGKDGCLETVASATGIRRLALERLADESLETALRQIVDRKRDITAKDVFDLVDRDPVAREIVDEVCSYLGFAIAMLTATLNPEAVILGGGVAKAGERLLNPVRHHYQRYAFPTTRDDTKILLATLGNDAGIFGAGWLVKRGMNL